MAEDTAIQSLVRKAIAAVEQTAQSVRERRDERGLPLRGEAADLDAGEEAHALFFHGVGEEVANLVTPSDLAPAVKFWGHTVDDKQWRALAQIAGKLGWKVEPRELRRWWEGRL